MARRSGLHDYYIPGWPLNTESRLGDDLAVMTIGPKLVDVNVDIETNRFHMTIAKRHVGPARVRASEPEEIECLVTTTTKFERLRLPERVLHRKK